MPFSLVAFLRRELAPTPGRFGATLRLTLACTAATVPIMIHHIPHGLVVMIVMYLITKEDTTATVLGSVLGLVGVTLGFALALLAWQFALQSALRLLFVFLFAALGLYIARSVVLGAVGSAIGVPAAMAMVLPDIVPVPDAEAMTEFVLWLWWCIALGLGVNLGVQLLLSPGDPLTLLRRALTERLRAVEELARSLAARGRGETSPGRASLTSLTIAGASEMLTLLRMATLRHAWARQHRAELGALISLVDQLVTAAAALEAARPRTLAGDAPERLERIAAACASTARALSRASPMPGGDPDIFISSSVVRDGVPALAAMERALHAIGLALPRRDRSGPRSPAPTPAQPASLLLPDAFSNPEYLRFAVRGGLACLVADVILVGVAYPNIYTAVITCFVVSLSTVGASTQKGLLRFAGAAVGGGMGIFALIYVLPHVDTLAGFWVVFATGTVIAGWVNFGSPRVSYGGYQVGLAFYKAILQGWGQVTELKVARDRLIGIAFGLVVFGVLEHLLWPVRATDRRRERLADVFRALAALARLGDRQKRDVGQAPAPDRELDEMRTRTAHDLADTQRLLEESKFEVQGGELEAFQRTVGDAQVIFLLLLSLAYQRRAAGPLLAGLPGAARQLEEDVARTLEGHAASARRPPAQRAADLQASLASVEVALAESARGESSQEAMAALQHRMELYRTLVRFVRELDPSPTRPADVGAVSAR